MEISLNRKKEDMVTGNISKKNFYGKSIIKCKNITGELSNDATIGLKNILNIEKNII